MQRALSFHAVQSQLQKAKRVDIVWDKYHKNSLKACTRNHRGNGTRRGVQGNNQLSCNWQQFLRMYGNKKGLFMFLGESLAALEVPPTKQLMKTSKQSIMSHPLKTINCNLSPCSQEEEGTTVVLNAADALKNHHNMLIRTVDKDILVLVVSFSHAYCQEKHKYGLRKVQVQNLSIYLHIKYCKALDQEWSQHYRAFMHLLVVIQCFPLLEDE